ncbi:exodeoxyribonuclease V subunit beta [Myxococcota bacterium]|nr:exodeoxyribonuclease V subunit beta [Myxococcota bacterium]
MPPVNAPLTLDPLTIRLNGINLIEASAGTGKTYTIATLVLRLIIERDLDISKILVVTFTNAATSELRARIRQRLRDALVAINRGHDKDDHLDAIAKRSIQENTKEHHLGRLRLALQSFDEASIFTIHSFCQRVLHESAFESGVAFDAELQTDSSALQRDVISDFMAQQAHGLSLDLLRIARAHAFDHEKLQKLITSASSPDLKIIPPHQDVDLDEAIQKLKLARKKAVQLWEQSSDQIIALLSSGTLKATSYKPDQIATSWPREILAELTSENPAEPPVLISKLTSAALLKATKKAALANPIAHPFFDACDELVQHSAEFGETMAVWFTNLQLSAIQFAQNNIKSRKAASDLRAFDDLLLLVRDSLRGPGAEAFAAQIHSRYPIALIDEFQDTDSVQYEIFSRVYKDKAQKPGSALFMIGDPKQAIYAFRGADIFTYFAAKELAEESAFTLKTNWRSDKLLLTAFNSLFKRCDYPFASPEIPYIEVDAPPDKKSPTGQQAAPFQIHFLEGTDEVVKKTGLEKARGKDDARAIIHTTLAADIATQLQGGALINDKRAEPGDMAVLCRTHFEARAIQDELRALHIPSIRRDDQNVFTTPEADDLYYLLRAIINPAGRGHLQTALSTTLIGKDALYIQSIEENDGKKNDGEENDGEENEAKRDIWLSLFKDWLLLWHQHGFMRAFHKILTELQVFERFLKLPDGERRLTDLLHITELLFTATHQNKFGPAALVDYLQRLRSDEDARDAQGSDTAQIRLESDAHAVQIVTIHSSKGLEYPIVYLSGLWDGGPVQKMGKTKDPKAKTAKAPVVFHDANDSDKRTLDIGSPEQRDHRDMAQGEAFAEALRLTYVALTRAKHRCVLYYGKIKDSEHSALAYLLHPVLHSTPNTDEGKEAPSLFELYSRSRDRLGELESPALLAELQALGSSSKGAISIQEISAQPPTALPYNPTADPDQNLSVLTIERSLKANRRITSFSGLTAEHSDFHAGDQAADRDSNTSSPSPAAPDAPSGSTKITLADFPMGAAIGIMIHSVFEEANFQDPLSIQETTTKITQASGLDPAQVRTLSDAISEVVKTPLPPLSDGDAPFCLADLSPSKRLDELEFLLESGSQERLSSESIKSFFPKSRAPGIDDYIQSIQPTKSLAFEPLMGFLRGFIDLVFEHEGKFYVVDYKSNYLGSQAKDYVPSKLNPAMASHHYYLQYHLYSVALHRYLQLRLPDYDFDTHFGGIYYLFVRGMHPDLPDANGIFADRPNKALINQLNDVVSGTTGAL